MTRKDVMLSAVVVLAATLGLAAALVIRPADDSRSAEAYVLFLGALGVALLTRATSRTFPAPTASGIAGALARRPRKPERVAELERVERELEMAMQSAYDTHYRLRPILRELATARLARFAVDLDGAGDRAEELLGPDAWALVRPDVARPSDHHAPGVRLPSVERAITALEGLGT